MFLSFIPTICKKDKDIKVYGNASTDSVAYFAMLFSACLSLLLYDMAEKAAS